MDDQERQRRDRIAPGLGARLRQLRLERRLYQEELGKYFGRDQQAMSFWEKTGVIMAYELPTLSRVLRVPIEAFFNPADLYTREDALKDVDWALQAAVVQLTPRQRDALRQFVQALVGEEPLQGDA